MDPDTFAPSDVIHLFVMEIDLDLSVGDPGGAAAPDDDEVGEFSDEELVDLPEGDDDDAPIVIDNVNDAIAQLAALEVVLLSVRMPMSSVVPRNRHRPH